MKMNENELCDDLPDEEFEDDEDYNYNDEEEYMGEDEEEEEDDEEEESEPEENDVDMREKKRIKNAFEDDEAEEEDMVDNEDDDDDSIALNEFPKKLSFKKIQENPELLSETSCTSDVFKAESVRNEMETPTIANRTPLTSAPNSNSSTLQLPRYVLPYYGRQHHPS